MAQARTKARWFSALRHATTAVALSWLVYLGLGRFYPAPLCYAGVDDHCVQASMRALQSEPPDPAAFELAELGCRRGHSESCNNLGVCYQRGTGTTRDLARARELYAGSCSQGDWLACQNQAELVFDGEGGPADPEAGKRLLVKACDGGEGKSCRWLLAMNQGKEALRYARKGCELEDARSCSAAAILLAVDEPQSAELRERIGKLNAACSNDEASNCGALALLYSVGIGVERDPERAQALLKRTCTLGGTQACQVLEKPELLSNLGNSLRPLANAIIAGQARTPAAK
jgi:TPR repeat protein